MVDFANLIDMLVEDVAGRWSCEGIDVAEIRCQAASVDKLGFWSHESHCFDAVRALTASEQETYSSTESFHS